MQDKFVFSLTMAGSGEEALNVLRGGAKFNLILLDVLMPNQNGYTVLPEMRRIVGETVAIVMQSAHSHEQLIQRCILDGADTYMLKPLQIEAVKNIWQYCLIKNRHLTEVQEGEPAAPVQSFGVGSLAGGHGAGSHALGSSGGVGSSGGGGGGGGSVGGGGGGGVGVGGGVGSAVRVGDDPEVPPSACRTQ